MKISGLILIGASWAALANEAQIVDGNYMRYEGTGYDSAFFPCRNAEVWSITGGAAFDALVEYYRNSRTGPSGEIKASLELIVSPIDRAINPDSHFDAVAEVTAVISISEDENEIAFCRENSA